MMVLGDFLKQRIAPLRQRSRMAYMYTGLNDCSRIVRGPGSEFTRAELEAALQELQEREAAVDKELAAGTWRLRECEAALQEREVKVEEFQAERSASIGRIVRWAGEVNSSLEALDANPIWVAEAPLSLGVALQVLDAAAERLQGLESGVLDLLETEGRVVARGQLSTSSPISRATTPPSN
jgi:hypothetical protein